VPENAESVSNIKRKFNVEDPENDDDELYDHIDPKSGLPSFLYKRLRTYETYAQAGDPRNPWNDSVAMVLHDDVRGSNLAKAAYIYPIIQRTSVRAMRPTTMAMLAKDQGRKTQQSEEETEEEKEEKELRKQIDRYNLTIREPNEVEQERVAEIKATLDTVGAAAAPRE